jgi:CSLREA domain-containing protein
MTIIRCGMVKLVAIATIVMVATLRPGLADAVTLVVNTTADPGSGTCTSSACSLRDAINLATANDTITFAVPATDPGCTAPNVCSILLDGLTGSLSVYNALTIDGSGQHITITGPGLNSGTTPIQLLANFGPGLLIRGLTFSNGYCFDGDYAGIHCLAGGAILNAGTLTVKSSTFSGNAGGKSCFISPTGHFGCDPTSGGAIANLGSATIDASTFVGNEVDAGAEGAAIASFSGTLTVTNSTFYANTGNTTVFNGTGDCCFSYSAQPGSLVLTNSTLVAASGAGVENQVGTAPGIGTLTLSNTIIASSGGGSCLTPVNDAGGNLTDDATCGFTQATSLSSTNSSLGPLQDNGGPTQTVALLAGSPAAVSGVATNCPSTDQRGVPRPGSGQNCSSGAFQYLAPLTLGCAAPSAQVASAYGSALTGAGGARPYTYSITNGALPGGLTLDTSNGQISGVPTSPGTFNFTAQATDAASGSVSANCSITVSPVSARLHESPSSVAFGTVHRYHLLYRTVAVTNIGPIPAAIFSVSVVPAPGTPPHAFSAVNLCPSTLAPGKTCTVAVLLFASALGPQSANLVITSNALGSPQGIPLSATVVP